MAVVESLFYSRSALTEGWEATGGEGREGCGVDRMATGHSCGGGGGRRSKGGRQMFTYRAELRSSGGNKLVFVRKGGGGGCIRFIFRFKQRTR